MDTPITQEEARQALSSIHRSRQDVLAEIDVPAWYWWALAGGWVVLGVIGDTGLVWVSVAATVAFGAAHGAIAPRVLTGRRGSHRLSVRAEVVHHDLPVLVVGFLVAMVVVTVGLALLLHADGARHPSSWAGFVVGALVLCGGPRLIAWSRRRARARLG